MNAAVKGSCLVGMGIFVMFSGHPARGADGPLLVVVEAPSALDADAAEIRRAIGAELRCETIAPMKTPTEPSGRALIVALDGGRIAMSLRTNDAAPITRVIPAPVEPTARLRAIVWLAGNLARDQITPLLADTPAETTPLATIPSIAPAPTTEPAPVSRPATEPPPLGEAPTTIDAHMTTPNSSAPSQWSIGVADGPSVGLRGQFRGPGDYPKLANFFDEVGTIWQIEVQRRASVSGLFTGAALEGTVGSYAPQAVGAMAFVGTAKRHAHWRFEANIGVGIEVTEEPVSYTMLTATHDSTNGFASTITTTSGTDLRPSVYGGGAVAVSHPLTESLDAVLRLGAHLSTVSFDDWFLSATLGLRYSLL